MSGHPRRSVLVIGGGGHGAEVVSYLRRSPDFSVTALVDEVLADSPFAGLSLLRGLGELERFVSEQTVTPGYHVAVGDNRLRSSLALRIDGVGIPGLEPVLVQAGDAYVGDDVIVGAGSLVAPGAVITTRTEIGRHCIVNVKASVAHDCVIGDFANLNPGSTVCGWARIGDGAFIGAGATVIDRVSVGAWTIVGAGAVVTEDLPPGVVAVGVPARPVRRINAAEAMS